MATVGMVWLTVTMGSSARLTVWKRSIKTATTKPTPVPMTRPSAASVSVAAECIARSDASATSAYTTCTGLGSRKLGTMPNATTACHTARMHATVSVGTATRRLRARRSRRSRARARSPPAMPSCREVPSLSPAGVAVGSALGSLEWVCTYATSDFACENSVSVGWYLPILWSVDITSPSGR